MHKLNNESLMNIYEDAIRLNLERAFILLIEKELSRRGLLVGTSNV